MSVIVLSRYAGGNREDFTRMGKEAKRIIEGHGASWRIGQPHMGSDHMGQWITIAEYANWETYGKVTQALLEDSKYHKITDEIQTIAELKGQEVINLMKI